MYLTGFSLVIKLKSCFNRIFKVWTNICVRRRLVEIIQHVKWLGSGNFWQLIWSFFFAHFHFLFTHFATLFLMASFYAKPCSQCCSTESTEQHAIYFSSWNVNKNICLICWNVLLVFGFIVILVSISASVLGANVWALNGTLRVHKLDKLSV